MRPLQKPIAGAILAGGQSRRMGFNKAFVKTDGTTIIERTVRVMKEVFPSPVIIANEIPVYEGLGLPVYTDIIKGAGSLGGIYTALFHAEADFVFVAACDMPFLDPACIKAVIKDFAKTDCAVPCIGGKLHPMHALYSKRCMKEMEAQIREGNLRINDFFGRVRVKRLDEGYFKDLLITRSVENINSRIDLERAGIDEKER